jgi:hypothetical protein
MPMHLTTHISHTYAARNGAIEARIGEWGCMDATLPRGNNHPLPLPPSDDTDERAAAAASLLGLSPLICYDGLVDDPYAPWNPRPKRPFTQKIPPAPAPTMELRNLFP